MFLLLLSASSLSMESAVEQALEVAPELEARRKREAAAAAKVDVAFSTHLPRVDLEASYLARSPKNQLPVELPPIPGVEPVGDVDDVHHFQGGLKLGYRLLDFSRGALVDAAEAQAAAARHETENVKAKLAFSVRATYLAALLARDVKRIAGDSLEVAKEEERRAALRVEVGTGNQVALAQARVRVASLEAQKRRADSELVRHRTRLQSLLGGDALPPLGGDLESLSRPAPGLELERHPELLQLGAKRRAARRASDAEAYRFVPTLSVQGAVELVYPRALQLELGPVYSFGAVLSWPIFDGLKSSSTADMHEANAAALGKLSDATRRRIERELIDLEARARTARADLKSAEATLEQTKVYLRVAKAAVEAGTGTELDVHNAELGMDQAKTAMQRARFELAMARAKALMLYGVSREKQG